MPKHLFKKEDPEIEEKALKLYKQGFTMREVGKRVRRSRQWVCNIVNKSGKARNEKGGLVGKCVFCGKKLSNHPRCRRCGILLHKKNDKYKGQDGKQHTLIGRKGYCYQCWTALDKGSALRDT